MNKKNINLPQTAFSMKANLQNKEPGLVSFWDKIDLYKKLRSSRHGKEKFKDNRYKPKSRGKISTVENIEELIKERSEDREAALANERKKIKEEQGQIYTEERKDTKNELSLSPNATPHVTKAELDVK